MTQVSSSISSNGEECKVQQTKEQSNSIIYWQFYYQKEDEKKWLWDANEDEKLGTGLFDFRKAAEEMVKKCWIEQGIWNSKWGSLSVAWWKHEEPLEFDSESELNPQLEDSQLLFEIKSKKIRCSKSDIDKQWIAE